MDESRREWGSRSATMTTMVASISTSRISLMTRMFFITTTVMEILPMLLFKPGWVNLQSLFLDGEQASLILIMMPGWIYLSLTDTFIPRSILISGGRVLLNRLCFFAILGMESLSAWARLLAVRWQTPGRVAVWRLGIWMETDASTW